MRLPAPLLPALCALACAAPDARATRVERAQFMEARGQWLEAGELWQVLLLADRSDAEAARGLARALEAQGDPVGALAILTGARDAAPDDAALRDELGARLLKLGRLAAAFEEFRAAAAADPGWAAPRRAAGALGLRLGEVPDARRMLEEAARLEPGHAGTWVLLARARELDEDPEGALQAWAAADDRARLGADDALRAGRLGVERDEWRERAAGWVGRARDRAPHRADLHRLHAELLRLLDRDDEAVAALRRSLEADPGDLVVLEDLARAHARRGELAELAILVEHARAVEGGPLADRLAALAEEAAREAPGSDDTTPDDPSPDDPSPADG